MKKTMVGALAAVAASVVVGTGAAAPNGSGLEQLPVECDGVPTTVTVSSGASFWLDGNQYLLSTFTGTFTPLVGDVEVETKTYGNRTGLTGTPITCTTSFADPAEGTFEIVVTAVPVR